MNIYEQQGREKKAAAIAEQIRERWAVDHLDALLDDGDWWLRVACAAGYTRKTPPSMECRRMVIDMLRGK